MGSRPAHRRARIGWILPLSLVLLWSGLTAVGVIDDRFFPPPSTIGIGAVRMVAEGDLLGDTLLTITRIAAGFVIGVILLPHGSCDRRLPDGAAHRGTDAVRDLHRPW
ncbi:MAG: hypothetical protein U0R65_02525 [Candidatus Nanopelagicales bacterium]